MSQEYNNTLKKPRRTRSQRNRPVLVTDNEHTTEEQATPEAEPVEEVTTTTPEPAPTKRSGPRLPNFFSTVEKSEQKEKEGKSDVVQARLARATRGKASTNTGKAAAVTKATADTSSEQKGEKAPASSTRPATRPNQTFKTRYILGIAIYLFAANFIGTGITLLLNQMHADAVLVPPFDLFGGKVIIKTSTVLFLALLIIILVLLARFDLIPRSLAPSTAATNRSGSSKSSDSGPKQPPSAIRQGVKGEADHLYQEYRLSQRRTKKR
jgi:hypothetical protein